jgi:hypothetical protein
VEPVAAAGYVIIAAHAVLGVLLGALAGAIVSALGRGLAWGALAGAAIYLGEALLQSTRLAAAALIGLPPLILTLLACWLTARWLQARLKWRRLWAVPAACAAAVILGFLWMLLFRHSLEAPITVALVADACLLILLYRTSRSS